jgi:hypothetical protein
VKLKATNANGNNTVEKMEFIIVDYPVSINDNVKLNFVIFPNPAKEVLYVKGDYNITDSKIEILDLNGKLLKTVSDTDKVDVSDLPSGLFLVRITDKNKLGIKKVVITK